MNITLLHSSGPAKAATVLDWRQRIGATDDDAITLVSWRPAADPETPLALDDHIVLGPQTPTSTANPVLRLRASLERVPRLGRAARLISDGTSSRYAAAAVRSGAARDAFAASDIVIAVDTTSQAAAWLLAQRIAGTRVVAGLDAGQRVIRELRDAR